MNMLLSVSDNQLASQSGAYLGSTQTTKAGAPPARVTPSGKFKAQVVSLSTPTEFKFLSVHVGPFSPSR